MLRLPSKLLLLILLFTSGAQGAELLVHGNEQAMWIAVVTDAPKGERGMRTRIRMKVFGGDTAWRELRPVGGKVISLASRGQTLAVLLDTGDWLLTYPNGESIGPALPSKQRILYLASEKDVLYAIAARGPARGTATAPTQPTVTTLPSTQPVDGGEDALELYRFETAKWQKIANLPEDLPREDRRIRLAAFGGRAMIAVAGKGGVIRVLQLDDDAAWIERGVISPKIDPRFFEILNIDARPAIWMAGATGAGMLSFWMGSEFAPPTELFPKKPLDPKSLREAIYAKGNIREIVLNDAKLFEQCYRPDGSTSSDFTELAQPRLPVAPVSNLPSTLLMVALAVLILASMRRGEAEAPVVLKSLSVRLAPIGTRMLAALIDLAPVIAAGIYLQMRYTDEGMTSDDLVWPLIAGVGVYLLHTTVFELFTARTVGKFVCGLKVVNMDGSEAGWVPLLLRNLLRAVDLFPIFPLAVMISFTPLRQRVGDITARTIVISLREPSEAPNEPAESD